MISNTPITLFGLTLHRLTHDKIELLRCWRNDPKIQQHMFYRDYITPEMQEAWFAKINNEHNYYFIVVYEGKEIGMVNIKDINYEKGSGETGIFIYEDAYLNSDVAARACLACHDVAFYYIDLHLTYGQIITSNKPAIQLSKRLGYKLQEQKGDWSSWILTKEQYEQSTTLIRYYLC